MSERPHDLPDYKNPPIAEVAMGVHFSELKDLRAWHIGLYWEKIRKDFPRAEAHAPLPFRGQVGIQLSQGPPPVPRCWFLDETGNRLIQLQADRFSHNWRKVKDEEPYPRYESIRDDFIARWGGFRDFLAYEGLGTPNLTLCELTYVNLVPKDTCWATPEDIPRVFTFLAERTQFGKLPPASQITCNLRYELPDSHGHLHVALSPAVRNRDARPVLRFDLSVQASPEFQDDDRHMNLLQWLDGARVWIVRTFTHLTTEGAHDYWQRIV